MITIHTPVGWGWGHITVAGTPGPEDAVITRIEVTDHHGVTVVLDAAQADALAARLDDWPAGLAPMPTGAERTVAELLREAATLARREARPPRRGPIIVPWHPVATYP